MHGSCMARPKAELKNFWRGYYDEETKRVSKVSRGRPRGVARDVRYEVLVMTCLQFIP